MLWHFVRLAPDYAGSNMSTTDTVTLLQGEIQSLLL